LREFIELLECRQLGFGCDDNTVEISDKIIEKGKFCDMLTALKFRYFICNIPVKIAVYCDLFLANGYIEIVSIRFKDTLADGLKLNSKRNNCIAGKLTDLNAAVINFI